MARKRDLVSDADEAKALSEEQRIAHRDAAMQRVRVGVTGLAAVFLLTLLAASIFNLLGQDDHGMTRLANGQTVASNSAAAAAEDTPREPLAELGVAPGNTPKPAMTTAAPASLAPRPAPAAVPAQAPHAASPAGTTQRSPHG